MSIAIVNRAEAQHPHSRRPRQEVADFLSGYESADGTKSQRQIAEELGIPRSTLQHWLTRKGHIDAEPELVSFFESPIGTAFMHRLALGAHFVMTMSGTGSVRHICQFFELVGLDQFIASSYGAQYGVSAKDILGSLQEKDCPFNTLSKEELQLIEQACQQCADLFQRSSSCVEGRNGQLSLRHHGLHRLSNRKLAALTAVHNYFMRRRDGTTPAERFFGNKPREMFEFLLGNIDLPGRPVRGRS